MIKQSLIILLFLCWGAVSAQKVETESSDFSYDKLTFTPTDFKASLSNSDLVQANDGKIYIGNLNGALEFDGSEWRTLELPAYSLASTLFYEPKNDKLYVGSTDEFGYFEKDSTGIRTYKSMRHLVSTNKPIPDIYQIIKHKGNIYFVSNDLVLKWNGDAFVKLPIKESLFLQLGDEIFISILNKGLAIFEGDSVRYVNTKVKSEFENLFGEVSLGGDDYLLTTYSSGMYKFNTRSYEIEEWKNEASELAVKNYVADIRVWRDSLYLMATYEKGLIISDRSGNLIHNLNDSTGLSTNSLSYIYFDKSDNIWLFNYYGMDVLRLSSNSQVNADVTPQINFVTINGKENPIAKIAQPLSSPSDVRLDFSIPGLFHQDLEYRFYLEGRETDWSEWQNVPNKQYDQLRAGNYTFHLQARSKDGQESQVVTQSFVIPTPWHQNPYTFLIAILVIGLLIFTTNRVINKNLKKDNKNLEKLVKERTVELEEANEGLKLINAELDNFVYRSSHDLVAPLKSLKGLINIAKIDNSEENRTQYLEKMDSRVYKLEEFIKSIMEYSINSKQKVKKEEVKLDEVIEDISQDLKYYVNANKVELKKSYPDDAKVFTDQKRLSIILSNLMTNSLKYHNYEQPAPFVEVKMEATVDFHKIYIMDNGLGIKKEFLDKIFNMFFRASDSSEGSGLGLYIVKDMINKIGGEITVKSDIGIGTVFTVVLPRV